MSTFLQLPNGSILTDDWTPLQPMVHTYQTISIDALISAILRSRADWLGDGIPLNAIKIPVADMYEEFAAILANLGLADAYERIGISETCVHLVRHENV